MSAFVMTLYVFYPCFAVDVSLLLQEKLHHLDVSIVTCYMERCVAHLTKDKTSEHS